MRITVAAVGRLKPGPLKELVAEYARRLAWPLVMREVEERRRLPPEALQAREADLLLAAVPRGARLVALDERGAILSSQEFSDLLGRWRDSGAGEIAFLIGGADGLGAAVRDRAETSLALGRMTWPHLLARVLLMEQLYRAQQILAGHPYHRES